MRPSAPANITVNTVHEGDRAVVEVEALDADASFLNFLRTSAVVLRPDGETEPLLLQQTGPGRYRGEFKTDVDGAYLVNINFVGGPEEARIRGNLQAAVSVPYPREFPAVKHNAALLTELAERTGGRVLLADPQLAQLFDRQNLEVPKSPKSVWDLAAILAAALFVVDVATRRLAVDRRAMARLATRAVGKRQEVSTATVAAWKRVAKRRDATAEPAAAATRFAAGDADEALAIDVAAEGAGTPKRPTRAAAAQQAREPQAPDDEGQYTSRLLAAKRRARKQAQSPDDAPPEEEAPDACASRSTRRSSARSASLHRR